MAQRGEYLRFALEPRESIGIAGNRLRQHFDRDGAIQVCVDGAIDLAHTAHTDLGADFVRAETVTRCNRHV
jgi:hypothetical protein